MSGDCFQAAVTAAETLWSEGAEALVAHGMPIGRGEKNRGARYWHAWVETKVPGRGWYVIDVSNGNQVGVKRTDFYRLGQIEPEKVHRFTEVEARNEMLNRGHFGPWVDNYEAMALRSATAKTPRSSLAEVAESGDVV
jgi:hypothetical protein